MSTFTKIAWRNITRNPHRSSITIGAVAIGLCCMIFLKGFVDGADRQMVENYTDLSTGHMQLHAAGYQKNMGLDKSIVNPKHLLALLQNTPGIQAVSPRIKDSALISSAQSSSGVLIYGINPASENGLSTLHKRIRKGKFLHEQDDDKIVIGTSLAEQLKVGLGEKVVLMSQGRDGSLAAAAYEICGLLESGAEEIDKGLALITLNAANSLLVMDGRISEIAIKTSSIKKIDATKALLKTKIPAEKYEVLDWKEISPMTYQWTQFDQVFTHIILFIVLLVVAAGILNTVLMSVLERTREFGIMLALGTKPSQVTKVIFIESFFLGLIGVLLGSTSGTGLVIFFSRAGINLSAISEALNSFYIGSTIYTRLDPASLLAYSGIVLSICVLVSTLPARKASRLSPVEAIRHT